MDSAAKVTITVHDGEGTLVRTLKTDEDRFPGYFWVVWDGKNDLAAAVPDADYEIEVTATATDGSKKTLSLATAVDRRAPAQLTAPVAGASLAGLVDLVVTPAAGITVTDVWWDLPGCYWSADEPEGDGVFAVRQADVSQCLAGAQDLKWGVEWQDKFNSFHDFYQEVSVTLTDNGTAPVVTLETDEQLVVPLLEPGVSGLNVEFNCRDNSARVTWAWQLRDGSGTIVRSWSGTDPDAKVEQNCRGGNGSRLWIDGRDDAGQPLPGGQYELTATATDDSGLSGSASFPLVVDARVPGVLSAPTDGASLSGPVDLILTPNAELDVWGVSWSLPGCSWYQSRRSADGTFAVLGADTSSCTAGDQTLSTIVFWRDELGYVNKYSLKTSVAVIDDGKAPAVTLSYPGFKPAITLVGPGNRGAVSVAYRCADNSAEVSWSWQLFAPDGAVVRTWGARDPQTYAAESCFGGYETHARVTVEGLDAAGALLADGTYTLRATATDAAGMSGSVDVPVLVDTRVPAVLDSPQAGATLSGAVDFKVTPTAGVPVSSVQWWLQGCSWSQSKASADGTFSVSGADLAGCGSGEQGLTTLVNWQDAVGSPHSYYIQTPVVVTATEDTTAPVVAVPRGYENPAVILTAPGVRSTASVYFTCVDNSVVTWAWRLTDSAGARVRDWSDGSGHESWGPSRCVSGSTGYVRVDGQDGSGAALPDGQYTLTATVTDSGGLSGSVDVPLIIDTRVPGVLTSPQAGAVLSGTVDLVLTPTQGMNLASVSWWLPGCYWSQYQSAPNGTFSALGRSTAGCTAGQQELVTQVSWLDQRGVGRDYRFSTAVTVPEDDSAPVVAPVGSGSRLITTSAPGIPTPDYAYFACSDTSRVTWAWLLTDSAGGVVRTWKAGSPGTSASTICQGNLNGPTLDGSVKLDGFDQSGELLADGDYTLTATVTDAGGRSGSAQVPVVADTRAPGVLTSPQAGAVLSGSLDLVLTPTDGVKVTSVYWSLPGCAWYESQPAANGTLQALGKSLAQCALSPGENTLTTQLYWLDRFGGSRSYTFTTLVTLAADDVAPVVAQQAGYGALNIWATAPDSPTREETYFSCSDASKVSWAWRLIDAEDAVVRTWNAGDADTRSSTVCVGNYDASITLDGRDGSGAVLPDGQYTLKATVTDAGGLSGTTEIPVVVNTQPPGALMSPAAGAVVKGSMDLVFKPTDGMRVVAVTWSMPGCTWYAQASQSGTYTVPAAGLAGCLGGTQTLKTAITWYDPSGYYRQYSLPITVIVGDDGAPPVLSVPDSQKPVIAPISPDKLNGRAYFACVNDSGVVWAWELADSEGAVVRAWKQGDLGTWGSTGCLGGYDGSVSMDGLDAVGSALTDGEYMLTATVADYAGRSASAQVPVLVDSRKPVALSTPTAGTTLLGRVNLRVAPTSGMGVSDVSWRLQGRWWSDSSADVDGAFSVEADMSDCPPGPQTLQTSVSWSDPFGSPRSYFFDTPVILGDETAPVVSVNSLYERPAIILTAPGAISGQAGFDCVDAAEVTWVLRLTDEAGSVVRTWDFDTPRRCGGWSPASTLRMDGRNDAGELLPDAAYTLTAVATDEGGLSGSASVPVMKNTQVPGELTAPEPGATLNGAVDLVVTPNPDMGVSRVEWTLHGCSWSQNTPNAEGAFAIRSASVASCHSGEQDLVTSVHWRDAASQSWTYTFTTPVTISDDTTAPKVKVLSGSEFPGITLSTPGTRTQAHVDFECRDNSGVTWAWVLTDPAGVAVRSWKSGENGAWGSSYCEASRISGQLHLDGLDGSGIPLPDGSYTLTATVIDAVGLSGTVDVPLLVDTRIPAQLTSPAADTMLSGSVDLRVEPTPGMAVSRVDWVISGCHWSQTDADPDGAFALTGESLVGCASGPQTLNWRVTWRDANGQARDYTSSTAVTVSDDSVPPSVVVNPNQHHTVITASAPGRRVGATIAFACSDTSPVSWSWQLLNSSQVPVRKWKSGDSGAQGSQWCSDRFASVTLDGNDETGTPMPDGEYTLVATVTDAAGLSGTAEVAVQIDTRAPAAIASPVEGLTLDGTVDLVAEPTSGMDVNSVYWSLPGCYWSQDQVNEAGTFSIPRAAVAGCAKGEQELSWQVIWSDAYGRRHTYSGAPISVLVAPAPIELDVSADPISGTAPMTTTLTVTLADPNSQAITIDVDWGDGTTDRTTAQAPYPPLTQQHQYTQPGTYRVTVLARGAGSGEASKSVTVTAADGTNTAPTLTVATTPLTGAAPLEVTATLDSADADEDPLTYKVDWGDGTDPETGSANVSVQTRHTFTKSGIYAVHMEVSDGQLTAAQTRRITVILPEPLTADAGDDQVAAVGDSVRLDASGSRPATLITGYQWDFGDGSTGSGIVAQHEYTQPGSYEVTLIATAGAQRDIDTATIRIEPESAGVEITVRDSSALLSGASVALVDITDKHHKCVTGGAGTCRLVGVPDGTWTIYAWAPGYEPTVGSVTVQGGAGHGEVTLTPGAAAQVSLTSERLTDEEARSLGIDLSDPANLNSKTVTITLGTTSFTGVVSSSGWTARAGGGGSSGGGSSGGGFSGGGYTAYPSVRQVGDGFGVFWIVVPTKATWLKEFFEVTLLVQNLSGDGFAITDAAATLNLPDGLTLAPTGQTQSLTAPVPDIPGGEEASIGWIVRGDKKGSYRPTADFVATLQPVEAPLTLRAEIDEPIKVWGEDAISVSVVADETAYRGYPFHLTATITNQADVPIYNVTYEMLQKADKGFIYQPLEDRSLSVEAIQPGQSLSNEVILVPQESGDIDLASSFLASSGGIRVSGAAITTRPVPPRPIDDSLTVGALDKKLGVTWTPVPGAPDAQDYRIFMTTGRDVEFGADPVDVQMVEPTPEGRFRAVIHNVPAGEDRFVAVSTITDGKPAMMHPMVGAQAHAVAKSPTFAWEFQTKNGSGSLCLSADEASGSAAVDLEFNDVFGLETFTITRQTDEGPVLSTTEDARGRTHWSGTQAFSVPRGSTVTVRAYATNLAGDVGPVKEFFLDTRCPVKRAAVVAMGLNSGLEREAPTRSVTNPDCSDRKREDLFNEQAATNACDEGEPNTDPQGNLVAYLQDKGFDPGKDRSSPERTLLEFSYDGVDVNCQSMTFEPATYTGADTYRQLATQVAEGRIGTATQYYEALEEYSDCWRDEKGYELRYFVVGHSLGGYEALGIAQAAYNDGRPQLITSIVTVDGAIQDRWVMPMLSAGDCFTDGFLSELGDLAWLVTGARITAQSELERMLVSGLTTQAEERANQMKVLKDSGIRIATVTNRLDSCLREPATLNYGATRSESWTIDAGSAGVDRHSAALTAHSAPVSEPGYPLAAFLDTFWFKSDSPGAAFSPSETSGAGNGPTGVRALGGATEGQPTGVSVLRGRVIRELTREPVAYGQVVASGPGGDRRVPLSSDGTFRFDGLPSGQYRVHVLPFEREVAGRWLGGSTFDSARIIEVDGDVDLGDVSGLEYPSAELTVRNSDGSAVTGGVAVVADGQGRVHFSGRTDDSGKVIIKAAPGAYQVTVGSLNTRPVTVPIRLGSDSDAHVEVDLSAASRVVSEFLDSQGRGVPGVLAVLRREGQPQAAGWTDSRGRFAFLGLAEGPYEVQFLEPLGRFTPPASRLLATAGSGSSPDAGLVTSKIGQAPMFTPSNPPAGSVGDQYSYKFAASGASEFAVSAGSLPDGVSLTAAGDLTGTPTRPGKFNFAVSARNSYGSSSAGPFEISILDKPPVFTSAPPPQSGTIGSSYNHKFTASGATTVFAVQTGTLPAGLELSPQGLLAGTLTRAGTFIFSVAASNASGSSVAGPYTVVVQGTPDTTPPQVDAHAVGVMGLAGWYRGDVQITWEVSDPESSEVTTSGCGPVTITNDAAAQDVTCTARSAGGESVKSVRVKRDATAPILTCPVERPVFAVGAPGVVAASVSDSMSGPNAPSVSRSVDTSAVGQFSIILESVDAAGNPSASECGYTVAAAPAPVDSDADGLADVFDKCPTQIGPVSNGGCPIEKPDTRPVPVVKVKAVAKAGKIFLDIDPNLPKARYWRFTVQKLAPDGRTWKNWRPYKTLTSRETRTVNPSKGTYRIVVLEQQGYRSAVSAQVMLRR